MKNKLPILLFPFLIALNVFSQEKKEPDFKSFDITKTGQDVPDFLFKTINGKQYRMSKLKGKTVLLVFFATWCGPCMKELPLIENEIWQQYKSDDFMVVALGRKHTMEEIKKFNKTKNFTFFLAPDPERKIYGMFFKQYIPRCVLVDKKGKIVYQEYGYKKENIKKLKGLIEKETK